MVSQPHQGAISPGSAH